MPPHLFQGPGSILKEFFTVEESELELRKMNIKSNKLVYFQKRNEKNLECHPQLVYSNYQMKQLAVN